jgi:uncharacterized protein YbjT (DUF2867 family)
MKIVVTGSLGHVSMPLTQQLVEKGHSVTVVTRSADKQKDIEALGAAAAVGSMEDVDFLTRTFTGADAAYCMMVPGRTGFNDPSHGADEIMKGAAKIADGYVQAITNSGVKRIVYLGSVGAHMHKGNGLLALHHNAENTLNKLPADISISFMRPVGFYDNFLNFIPAIKSKGVIAANYGGEDRALVVSPIDIATAIVEELTATATGRKVRYVVSEDLTSNEVATILGEAIGKPDLKWVVISDERQLAGLKAFGMNESIARSFVEMNAAIHNGKIYEDYDKHIPTLGNVKLKEFAWHFAEVYNKD